MLGREMASSCYGTSTPSAHSTSKTLMKIVVIRSDKNQTVQPQKLATHLKSLIYKLEKSLYLFTEKQKALISLQWAMVFLGICLIPGFLHDLAHMCFIVLL